MKRIFLSALIGVGMAALIFSLFSGRSAAQLKGRESYPLVCRGGRRLEIGIAPGVTNIGFTFSKGTKPAGKGLAPGECSWVDRGMHADEPDKVSQFVRKDIPVVGAPIWPETLKVYLAPKNRWYKELHSPDKYWTFMVTNDGGELNAGDARPNASEGIDVTATAKLPPDIGVIERPRSYPLVCRGSDSLVIGFAPSVRTIGFTFTRGTKPAGEGLDPGECSWVDRGMHADEPDRLSQPVEDSWEESLKVGGTLAPENRWYEELHSSRKSWTFMVYNHRSVLNVTSARPNG